MKLKHSIPKDKRKRSKTHEVIMLKMWKTTKENKSTNQNPLKGASDKRKTLRCVHCIIWTSNKRLLIALLLLFAFSKAICYVHCSLSICSFSVLQEISSFSILFKIITIKLFSICDARSLLFGKLLCLWLFNIIRT